jgi:dihydrofolate reductase
MRPLILKMEMSVDGFVGQPGEVPGWPTSFYDEALSAEMLDLVSSAGVHAMGRGAYEEMAPYWQSSSDSFAEPMNEIPKAVFSRTMTEATWPESTIYRDLDSGMAELKAQDGAPILTYGGATFAQELTRRGLVDEYRINVHPIAFGTGYRLFGGPVDLVLQDVRRFGAGSVAYTYVPSGRPTA